MNTTVSKKELVAALCDGVAASQSLSDAIAASIYQGCGGVNTGSLEEWEEAVYEKATADAFKFLVNLLAEEDDPIEGLRLWAASVAQNADSIREGGELA